MKRTIFKRMLALLLCVTVLVPMMVLPTNNRIGGGLQIAYGVTNEEIQAEKDKQAAIEAAKKKAQQEIKDLESKKANTEAYMKTLDEKLSNLDLEIYNLGIDIKNKETKIEETKVELAEAEKIKEHQYEMMKLRIKFMYENNEQTYLAMFLESQSLADMLNKVEYISKLSEYDRNMLEEFKATIAKVASVQAQLEAELKDLNNTLVASEAKREAHNVIRAEKEKELAAYNTQLAQLEEKETGLEQLSKETLALIAKMEEEMRKQEAENNKNDSGTITNPYESGFIWPTISKRITSRYGWRKSGFHSGVDIGASRAGVWGDPIYAAQSGKVTLAAWDNGAGNWIWIYHGNGMYTVYMHMSKFLVGVGDEVKQGQTIGLMGSTGNSTGAHLHFSVRINGQYVNPEPYIGIK